MKSPLRTASCASDLPALTTPRLRAFEGAFLRHHSRMHISARQLNRATLARQLLLRREPIDVVDAVHRLVALQAQEPASPYIALWDRLDPFDPADLDAAFAEQDVVKAQLMRITLHAVAADDYPAFHEAMQGTLRAARLHDRRFKSEGVSIEDTDALSPSCSSSRRRPG